MLTQREKFIAILSNDIIASSDAIILLEGDGFNRVDKAVELYKAGLAPKILFSGGAVNYDYGSYPAKDIMPKLLELGVPEEDIIIEEKSMHTQAQAHEFAKLAKEKKWKRTILVASPDHQFRAYLTFLKEILKSELDLILFNSPVSNLPWNGDSSWGAPIKRLEEEFNKIEKYGEMGHLASFEEAIEYQEWKERRLKKQK